MRLLLTPLTRSLFLLGTTVLFLACAGCQNHVTRYPVITTPHADVEQLGPTTRQVQPVEGKAGIFVLGPIPTSLRSAGSIATGHAGVGYPIDDAVSRALGQAPGAVAVADVVRYDSSFAVPFLFQWRTCKVRGTPLRKAPSEPGDARTDDTAREAAARALGP
jgi:hypothetical protein